MTATLPPEGTRAALIEAGLRLFGQEGFAASSTRALAAAAKTNVASIAYHFGSKEGLRAACAQEVVRRISRVIDAPPTPRSAQEAEEILVALLTRLVSFLVAEPGSDAVAPFVLRALAEEGEAMETLYSGLMEPRHQMLCALWQAATGKPADSDTVRLRVFSLIGQVFYFRFARPVVARRMGWSRPGPEQAAKLIEVLSFNLRAVIAAERLR